MAVKGSWFRKYWWVIGAIVILAAVFFVIGSNQNSTSQGSESTSQGSESTNLPAKQGHLRFDHNDLTFYIDKVCGTYETGRIRSGFSVISKEVSAIQFIEQNVSDNPDIEITCSFIDNCYKERIDSMGDGSFYTTEYTCPYKPGITSITLSPNNIISKATIEMIGFSGFLESGASKPSGFSISDCGWPLRESREILKSIMGYAGGYDPEVLPIYSFDWSSKDYGILNTYKQSVGYSTRSEDACKNSTKEIDPWVLDDIQSVYSNNLTKKAYASECSNFYTTDRLDWCQFNVSLQKKDYSSCSIISDPFIKEGCYQAVAMVSKEIAPCNLIQDKGIKSSCYFSISSLNKDASICANIADKDSRYNCYFNLSVETKNPKLCSKIEDVQSQNMKDSCLFFTAQSSSNVSICEDIMFVEKSICKAYASGNVENCSNIDSTYYSDCIISQAKYFVDVSRCNKIRAQVDKNYCYSSLALIMGESSLCSYIINSGDSDIQTAAQQKEDCYSNIAYDKKDFNLCANLNLNKGWDKDWCYWNLANTLKSSQICESLSDSSWKDYCKRSIFPMI